MIRVDADIVVVQSFYAASRVVADRNIDEDADADRCRVNIRFSYPGSVLVLDSLRVERYK